MRVKGLTVFAVSLGLLSMAGSLWAGESPGNPTSPPVYVSFWFDTEDYLLPASDDAAQRLADIFTSQGVQATFKVVGEKARVLRDRGRADVIAALRSHDIGYHTDFHSVHPTPSEYSRDLDWNDGVAEFIRREGRGFEDVRTIFGMDPSCYGQPGSSWTPESYAALRRWNIPVYLDDASQVGLDGRPFWYCGVLNAFNLSGFTTRCTLQNDATLDEGCKQFEQVRQRAAREGGGLISIYYHPCEWVHEKFWDGVNFSKGSNPPREQWQKPPQKPAEATERQFALFARYLEYARTRPNVRLVTAREIATLYPDGAYQRSFTREEIAAMARALAREVSFVRLGDRTVSAAEGVSVLAQAVVGFDKSRQIPESLKPKFFFGPTFEAGETIEQGEFAWNDWVKACRDCLTATEKLSRLPSVMRVGGKVVAPVDFAATLATAVGSIAETGRAPKAVRLVKGNWTVAKYVADDSPRLWGWVIFPDNFSAPKMMALARLQSWTLKPAILSAAQPKTAAPAASALSEKQKIAALLGVIEKSPDIFVRNDEEYPSPAARQLMEYKLKAAGDGIKTANDFIEQVATRSKTTGRVYMVKMSDGRTTESARWLRARLAEIERGGR